MKCSNRTLESQKRPEIKKMPDYSGINSWQMFTTRKPEVIICQ